MNKFNILSKMQWLKMKQLKKIKSKSKILLIKNLKHSNRLIKIKFKKKQRVYLNQIYSVQNKTLNRMKYVIHKHFLQAIRNYKIKFKMKKK